MYYLVAAPQPSSDCVLWAQQMCVSNLTAQEDLFQTCTTILHKLISSDWISSQQTIFSSFIKVSVHFIIAFVLVH